MFATGAAIEGSATIAGYSMNNTAMLLDTRDVLAHRTLVDPHVKVEIGKAGSCEFTILPTHTLYDKLKRMVTFITVEEIDPDINHDIVLFKGRIVELETDLYGQKKVTCEGDLAYLGDSYTPPLASKNTVIAVPRYFEEIITQHNGQVEAAKQFTVGDTSAFSGVEDKFSESSYQNSSRALEDLIEYHGGYLKTRHEGGTAYLDYVKDTATPGRAVPRVEFAKNLVDFTEKVSAEDIFTVLIPLGDKTDTGEGENANSVPLTLTPPKLNVDDVIQGAKAIDTFGYILRAETFSGVKDAVTLRQRAEAYIRANYNALPEEFTVKAIDLRYLDDDDAQVPFEVGENITIVVPVRGVSKTLKCLSIRYDLFNPDATEIEVGTGKQEIRQRSLTDQQAQTDAKSKSSAKSAKANTAATEYLTWKDIKAAKELNLTAQKINLLSDSAGGEIVVNQNGTLVFNWDNNKGLNKKVISAASVANQAKTTSEQAKTTADSNKTEVEHHAMTLYGANKSYGDWANENASLAKGGLMTFFNGKIAALEGFFDSVTANNVTTWGLSAQVSRFESITGHNLTATGITVRTSTDSSGQDVVQLGGSLQQTPPVMTVSGNGTVYVKDIKQLDNAKNWQSVVTHPEYPLLSIKTISNKKYLVAGADTKGQDGYSLDVQKVALEDLLDGANLADYAQLNTDVTFGTVTGSSFALPGTNSQGQPNSYTFTKHYIKMDDVAQIASGVNLPYYLGEDDLDLSHTHEIAFTPQEDSSGNPTGKYTLTLKKAVKKKAGTEGETATFDIAATKFYKDAIAAAKTNASVASIAYNGSATPGLSVGRTQTGSSAQTIVLNNVPLTLTLYGTEEVDGKTVAITQAHTVSGIELPSVSFQNGSGGTPAITYSGGKPTIDVKAVMSGTTIKSAETYTGNAVTLRPSFTAPSESTANKTFTLVAYDGTTIGDDTRITSKDVTLQHEISQITSSNKKYLRVRTNAKNDSGESSSPVFYTDYQITWNSDTIQNTNGSSSVTAKVSINGVQYDSHTFTGKYATAESDNETVRASGWTAAYGKVSLPSTQNNTGSMVVKTPAETEDATPNPVSTTYTLEQDDKWGSNNKKYVYIQNGTSEKNVARLQVDASKPVSDAKAAVTLSEEWKAYTENSMPAVRTYEVSNSANASVITKTLTLSDRGIAWTNNKKYVYLIDGTTSNGTNEARFEVDASTIVSTAATNATNAANAAVTLTGSWSNGKYTVTNSANDKKASTKLKNIALNGNLSSSNGKLYAPLKVNILDDNEDEVAVFTQSSLQLGSISWTNKTITNSSGSSSVEAEVSIGNVVLTHSYAGTYAAADSDNETVRADGWAAALNALTYSAPSSEMLDFGEAKTVWIQKRATEDADSTDIFRRTYTAPSEPYPILTPKYYGNALSAKMKIDAALNSKSDGTGTTYTNAASKTIELSGSAVTLAAKTGSATIVAKVDGTTYAEQSVSITAPNPVISVNTNGINEKSNKLPVSASLGTTTGLGSMNLEFTVSGGDAIANGPGSSVVQFKYGDKVISEKTVSATYSTIGASDGAAAFFLADSTAFIGGQTKIVWKNATLTGYNGDAMDPYGIQTTLINHKWFGIAANGTFYKLVLPTISSDGHNLSVTMHKQLANNQTEAIPIANGDTVSGKLNWKGKACSTSIVAACGSATIAFNITDAYTGGSGTTPGPGGDPGARSVATISLAPYYDYSISQYSMGTIVNITYDDGVTTSTTVTSPAVSTSYTFNL